MTSSTQDNSLWLFFVFVFTGRVVIFYEKSLVRFFLQILDGWFVTCCRKVFLSANRHFYWSKQIYSENIQLTLDNSIQFNTYCHGEHNKLKAFIHSTKYQTRSCVFTLISPFQFAAINEIVFLIVQVVGITVISKLFPVYQYVS